MLCVVDVGENIPGEHFTNMTSQTAKVRDYIIIAKNYSSEMFYCKKGYQLLIVTTSPTAEVVPLSFSTAL